MAGADDFLVKPVELMQLTEKLDRWLPLAEASSPTDAPAGSSLKAGLADSPLDQALLTRNCGGDASMVGEVLAAFRQTCSPSSLN